MEKSINSAYAHQEETTKFIIDNPCCLVTSDPGTGKTRSVLDAHVKWGGKTLVLAPLSILEAAWVDDIKKFQPDINYGVAFAKNRKKNEAVPWGGEGSAGLDQVRFSTVRVQLTATFDCNK